MSNQAIFGTLFGLCVGLFIMAIAFAGPIMTFYATICLILSSYLYFKEKK